MKAYACDHCNVLMLEDDVLITKFMEFDVATNHKVVITVFRNTSATPSNEYCKKCTIKHIETALEMLKNGHQDKKPDKTPSGSGSKVKNKTG